MSHSHSQETSYFKLNDVAILKCSKLQYRQAAWPLLLMHQVYGHCVCVLKPMKA